MLLKTPPMGFNTWNSFGENISADLLKETADAMVDQGLAAAGYEYIVIDDCWAERERDPKTGKIIPDHNKFPKGMKDLSDYIHAKGLKFGMYSCCGVRTCANYPGSFNHEFLDAQTFAEYGCDYLKYDDCFRPGTVDTVVLYRRMGMALKACGRDIVYSICHADRDKDGEWSRAIGGSLWRSTNDIHDSYESFMNIAVSQLNNYCYNYPGCFNDMDMLTVGMYGGGDNVHVRTTTGCNDEEYKSQFALWCLFGSPLMLGCDVRKLRPAARDLLTNKDLIAIDQDPEARGIIDVSCFKEDKYRLSVMRHLSNNKIAIGLFNKNGEPERDVQLLLSNCGLPMSGGYGLKMREIFSGEETGIIKDYFVTKIPHHGCKVYIAEVVKC
ncbi:MAG: glycoside hydrolase family 27 protein [Clostridia bacterium]|nr:glycoside hydrolase family 27 protein [Clostridia bacterium]